jgi:luciferase family oxidoreductase group 1
LAKRADQLGYHRFWVAEHHSSPLLAGSAPEILVANILARTSRIRVGSGGVLLQHYSPFKVAEVFKVLEGLAPGRVDLGVGKAPGGLPLSTRALQARHDSGKATDFNALLADLDAFLTGREPTEGALAGAVATPVPLSLPQRILLGASPESAELAARHGWDFSYAGHFNGDPDSIERSFETYRRLSGRSPSLALFAVAAQTQERADHLVGALRIYRVHLPGGRRVNLPNLEAIAEFARQAGVAEYRTEELQPTVLAGSADRVRGQLDELSDRYGVSEFILDNPAPNIADRLASVELLAGATASRAA